MSPSITIPKELRLRKRIEYQPPDSIDAGTCTLSRIGSASSDKKLAPFDASASGAGIGINVGAKVGITADVGTTAAGTRSGKKSSKKCNDYATAVTADMTCRCPHLDAYLPKFLDAGGLGLFDAENGSIDMQKKRRKRMTISDLHFSSILPSSSFLHGNLDPNLSNKGPHIPGNSMTMAAVTQETQAQLPFIFGGEERKTSAIISDGVAEYYAPVFPGTFVDQTRKERRIEIELEARNRMINSKQGVEGKKLKEKTCKDIILDESNKDVLMMGEELKDIVANSIDAEMMNPNDEPGKLGEEKSMPQESSIPTDNIQSSPVSKSPSDTQSSNIPVSVLSSNIQEESYKEKEMIERKIMELRTTLFNADNTSPGKVSTAMQKKNKPVSQAITEQLADSVGSKMHHDSFESSSLWKEAQAQRETDIQIAVDRIETWLEVIRQNRRAFWKRYNKKRHSDVTKFYNYNNNESQNLDDINCNRCVKAKTKKRRKGFRPHFLPKEDELMQCLDCGMIGCGGPNDAFAVRKCSKHHMQQHFLLSGHSLGITCGEKGSVFCFKCGDFVYSEVLEREKERVSIESNLPWFSWERHKILQRSFGFGQSSEDFVLVPDALDEKSDVDADNSGQAKSKHLTKRKIGTLVWRGFRAVYPNEVADEMILAAQRTLHRLRCFRGEMPYSRFLSSGALSSEFALRQRERGSKYWTIDCPVGIYNAGNICYISSVIQCIFNLSPVQQFFLRDVKHDCRTCEILRSSSSSSSSGIASPAICLACEMDKLMMEYYGSTVGLDVSILSDISDASSAGNAGGNGGTTAQNGNDEGETSAQLPHAAHSMKGTPIVLSDFLVAAWRSKEMLHLAGNEQHDAHEFLQAFLDIVDKDCKKFQTVITTLRDAPLRNRRVKGSGPGLDRPLNPHCTMTSLFGGNLRSVLMCDKCGFKRSRLEPFLNVSLSLPLGKNASSAYDSIDSSMGTRRSTLKIDVRTCIDHFSEPESLGDDVFCDWCQGKTKTFKQHTFAKLPTILCLHLKRFDATTNKKLDEPVSFPSTLDMGPYLPHWREVEQTNVLNKAPDKFTNNETHEDSSRPQVLYDLCGTINHSGTLFQGHYVSNVKIDGNWFSCNDSEIQKLTKDNAERKVLKSEEVYMMFYIRRSNS